MSEPVKQEYLSKKEAAVYLGVSESSVKRLIRNRKVEVTRVTPRRIAISARELGR